MRCLLLLAVLALATAAPQAGGLCPSIQADLPSFCSTNADCTTIKCAISLAGLISYSALMELDVCESRPSLTIDVDATVPPVHWDQTILLDQSDTYPIPDLDFSVLVFSAGVVADISFGGSMGALDLSLGFDVCIDVVLVGQVCGADIASYIPVLDGIVPLTIFNGTVDATQVSCGGSGSNTPSSGSGTHSSGSNALDAPLGFAGPYVNDPKWYKRDRPSHAQVMTAYRASLGVASSGPSGGSGSSSPSSGSTAASGSTGTSNSGM